MTTTSTSSETTSAVERFEAQKQLVVEGLLWFKELEMVTHVRALRLDRAEDDVSGEIVFFAAQLCERWRQTRLPHEFQMLAILHTRARAAFRARALTDAGRDSP